MVPADEVEPLPAAFVDEPFGELPRLGRAGRLLAVEPRQPADPVVRRVTDVRTVEPPRALEQPEVLPHEPDVRTVVVEVRIAEVEDADRQLFAHRDRDELARLFVRPLQVEAPDAIRY